MSDTTPNPDRQHLHHRWVKDLNRRPSDAGYSDDWYGQQCGGCLFYVRLDGTLGLDWGACTNQLSLFDRRVMFEHDGCEQFRTGGEFGALRPWAR